MTKTGVLIHVYHLGTINWEGLVWGTPSLDKMGSLPKLVELLLTESADEPIDTIIAYNGPSGEGDHTIGIYTKQFLIDHFDELPQFLQLRPRLEKLSDGERQNLKRRIESIIIGEKIENTKDEVEYAAKFFQSNNITRVIQLAALSHAPRCMQLQNIARSVGLISSDQLWYVVSTDTSFGNSGPKDVVIFEPPNRGDDPMLHVNPRIVDVLKPFFSLSAANKQACIADIQKFMDDHTSRKPQG